MPEQSEKAPRPAQKPPEQPPMTLQRVDLPELAETFADSIDLVFFDGQTLRINFGVTRFDQPQQSGAVNARRLPACRLVLTPSAAVELMNQIQQLTARMIQSGALKATPPPSQEKT
jgi:hypothetical protein